MVRLKLSESAAVAIVEEDKLTSSSGASQPPPQQLKLQHQHQHALVKPEPSDRGREESGPQESKGEASCSSPADDWEVAFDLFSEADAQGDSATVRKTAREAAAHTSSVHGHGSRGAAPEAGRAVEPQHTSVNGIGGAEGQGGGKCALAVQQTSQAFPQQQQQQQQKGGTHSRAALQPRILLFQQCQRARWSQPRYEKLAGPALQYGVSRRHSVQCCTSGRLFLNLSKPSGRALRGTF